MPFPLFGTGEMPACIRAHDWSATPLGPIDRWSDRIKAVVDLVLASPLVSSVALGPERRLIYNDAAALLYGDHHPGALGRPLAEAFPDSYPAVAPLYDRVFEGDAVRVAAQPLAIDGKDEVFDAWLTPVRDESGAVIGAHMIGLEIGEQVRAQAALRESEARYRTLFETITEGFGICELIRDDEGRPIDWRFLEINPAFEKHTGMSRDFWVGRRCGDLYPTEARNHWLEVYGAVVDTQTARMFEEHWAPLDRWFAGAATPLGGQMFNVAFEDVSERKRDEATTRASVERQALLLELSDALRPVGSPDDIQRIATRILGAKLRASRVFYVVVEPDGETGVILSDYTDGVASRVGRYALSAFSTDAVGEWRAGRIASTSDVDNDPRYSDAERAAYASVSTRAGFGIPLLKEGRLVALLGVNQSSPRRWTDEEFELAAEVAERTWAAIERARAEMALRESETMRRVALAGGRMGSWRWDRKADLIRGDEQFMALWGLPPSDEALSLSTFAARMSAEGASEMADIVTRTTAANEDFSGPLQIVAGPTAGSWVQWQGRAAAGDPSVLYGVTLDITEQKTAEARLRESEEKYRNLFEKMEEGYLVGEVIFEDGRATDIAYLEANPAAVRMIGVNVVGRRMRELDPNYEEYWYEAYGRAASTGVTERATQYASPVDRWYDYRISKLDPDDPDSRRVTVLFYDVSARVAAEQALRESEARYRRLFTSMDEAYAVVEVLKDDAGRWTDFRFVEVNPAFTVHTNMPYPVGKSATELLGTPNPRWIELYGRALDTGATLRVEETEGVLGTTFDLNIFALDRERNRVAVLFTNITDRKRAEIALRESEERQRLMIELVPALLWSTSSDGSEVSLNESWMTYTGQNNAETQNYGWLNAVHPDNLPDVRAAFEHAFATGEPLERQQRIHKADNGYRWHLVRHVPVRDEDGTITRWFGAAVDIHDSKVAEQALEATERRLQTLVDGVPQLVWRASDPGIWTWASPQWTAYTGQTEADSHGWGWLDPVHPDDRDRVRELWANATARGEFHAEYRLCHVEEHRYRWFQTRARPVRNEDGEIVEWLGTSTDVDDLRTLQDRQQVLVAELQHRTRNLLAVVRSTANRTGETSTSFADFRERFRDRLEALARVQGLLSRLNETDRIAFDELIRTEIAAMNGIGERVILDGPSGIRLRSSMVQTLAMALHELATNAVKYGALGQPDSHLVISWQMVEPDRRGQPRLRIHWQESGVKMPPTGARPQGGGQGRELIEKALPYQLNAETHFELGADGVRCTIIIPVSASTVMSTSG